MITRKVYNRTLNFFKTFTQRREKVTIDKSRIPTLNENDLEEEFIKGGGPGGQKVNKSNSCVYLLHKPSGMSVKVHDFRSQAENRKVARERLITMLDNVINKENSVENQKKRILKEKSIKKAQKQKKLREVKENWKETISKLTENKID